MQVTEEDKAVIRTELDVLNEELNTLYQVTPVSLEAAERLVQTRERVLDEMRRLERLLAS